MCPNQLIPLLLLLYTYVQGWFLVGDGYSKEHGATCTISSKSRDDVDGGDAKEGKLFMIVLIVS